MAGANTPESVQEMDQRGWEITKNNPEFRAGTKSLMTARMQNIVEAHLLGQKREAIEDESQKPANEPVASLAKFLLNLDSDQAGDLYDFIGGEEDSEYFRDLARRAIREAARNVCYTKRIYGDEDPVATTEKFGVIKRIGVLMDWRGYPTELDRRRDDDFRHARALYIMMERVGEDFVRDLVGGVVPRFDASGDYEFAEAAVVLAKHHPDWKALEKNPQAVVAFSRWRKSSHINVSNGSTGDFAESLDLKPEDFDEDAILTLAVLNEDRFINEAGRRGLKLPLDYMGPGAHRQYDRAKLNGYIEASAPEVFAALVNGRIAIDKAKAFIDRYRGDKIITDWIREHAEEVYEVDPKDPFAPKNKVEIA